MALAGDVSQPDQARQLVRDVVAAWERLDIVVNNAGIWDEDVAGQGRVDVWDRTYAVNQRGAFLVTDAAVAAPREDGRLDRLRLLDGGAARRGAALGVRRLQGRADLLHEVARGRARARGASGSTASRRAGWTRTCRRAPSATRSSAPRSRRRSRSAASPRAADIAGPDPLPRVGSRAPRPGRGPERQRRERAGGIGRAASPMERLDRRDLRFIAVCLLVIAAGAAVTSVALPPRLPRGVDRVRGQSRRGARVLAEKLLAERGPRRRGRALRRASSTSTRRPRSTSSASSASSAPGRSTGARPRSGSGGCAGSAPGVKEEEYVTVSPLGDLIGFAPCMKEDAPGARLSEAEARAVALRFLASRGPSRGRRSSRSRPRPSSRPEPHGLDVRRREGRRALRRTRRSATPRPCRATASTAFHEFVHVPEAWTRDYQQAALEERGGRAGRDVRALRDAARDARRPRAQDRAQGRALALVGAFGGDRVRAGAPLDAQRPPARRSSGYDTASPLSAYPRRAARPRRPRRGRDRRRHRDRRGRGRADLPRAVPAPVLPRAAPSRCAGSRRRRFCSSVAPRLRAGRLLLRLPGRLLRRGGALRRLGARPTCPTTTC